MTLTIAGTLMRKGGYGRQAGEVYGIDTDDLTVADHVGLDLNHVDPVGEVVHIERTDQGDIHVVGVVNHFDELAEVEGDLYLSGQMLVRHDGASTGWIGRRPHLISVAITASPAQIGLYPITILKGDLTSSYARSCWTWRDRSRPLLARAVEATSTLELRRAPLALVDLRPPAPLVAPLELCSKLEVRSANTVAVAEHQRTITVLAAPVADEATVVVAGKLIGETFARNAFAGDEHRVHRVKVNREHKFEWTIGRAVRIDPYTASGCVAELKISRTPLGDEALALAEDRALDCSVGFRIRPNGEVWDRSRTRRQVTAGQLDHIALVASPAYESASILDVRSYR